MSRRRDYREKVRERRKAQLDLRVRGFSRAEIHRELIAEFQSSARVLDEDWKLRRQWLPDVLDYADAQLAIGLRFGAYDATAKARYRLVEILQEILDGWYKQATENAEAEGRSVTPTEFGEIGPVIRLLRKLLNDVDLATDRELRVLIAMGLRLDFPGKEEKPKEEECASTKGTPKENVMPLFDRLMENMPENVQNAFMLALEKAIDGEEK